MSIKIDSLHTWPVKGLSGMAHPSIAITGGNVFPGDRAWAIEAGAKKFDPANPAWMPKIAFAQLMSHEKLAELETSIDTSRQGCLLTIHRNGKQVARGDLNTPIGRQLIEQFIAGFMGSDLRGSPRICHAAGHHFADVPARYISLINLATLREVERVAGKPVAPARFRANIIIDGADPWEEFSWLSKKIAIDGSPVFRVAERITRCAATSVNPETAVRDINLPRLLASAFRHEDFGVYVSALNDTHIEKGQTISIV